VAAIHVAGVRGEPCGAVRRLLLLLLSDFNETWILSKDFRKIFKYENFINIRPVGAEMCAGRRTDMAKLIVAICSFANSD